MKIKKWLSIPLILSLLVSTAAFTNADVVDEPEETNANEAEEVVEETVFSEEETSAEETIEDVTVVEETVDQEEMNEEFITTNEVSVVYIAEETEVVEEVTEYVNLYDYENALYTRGEVSYTSYAVCDMNVRGIADPNAEVLTTITKGTAVTVVMSSWDSPWVMVEVNGVQGYVILANLFSDPSVEIPGMSETDAEALFASAC